MADTLPAYFGRFSAARVTTALTDTPVVMVNGPHQSGKTTLARQFATAGRGKGAGEVTLAAVHRAHRRLHLRARRERELA